MGRRLFCVNNVNVVSKTNVVELVKLMERLFLKARDMTNAQVNLPMGATLQISW